VFTFDKDIIIDDIELWLDSKRVRELGFISHAHADHIARHKKIICTPTTAQFLKKRLKNPNVLSSEFGQPIPMNQHTINLFPAGHILGSAQIKIESKQGSLLYTGDFKIKSSRTVENFKFVNTNILIMESTFGLPKYTLPPRENVEDELIETCRQLLKKGRVPVVFAYALGKGQEALKILTDAGLPVAADYEIIKFLPVYQSQGIEFGTFKKFKRSEFRGSVLLLPPRYRYQRYIRSLDGVYRIFLSGWGMDDGAARRLFVDRVLPISDHADYNELIQLVETTKPNVVYCTHGFTQFVDALNNAGFNAFHLG